MNLRDQINNETLSLRKNRHRQDFFARRKFFFNDRSRHLICPLKLKGIPDKILEKFRINENDLDNTVQKTIEYLSSKELDDIKFGSFLLRRFFQLKTSNEAEKKKTPFHIDTFIDKGIIGVIGKVLITESNIDILSELTSTLVNITYLDTSKNSTEYMKEFITPTFYEIYYKLLKIGDNEINANLYLFLANCIIECDEFAISLFKEKNFIRLSIIKYLEPASLIKIEEQELRKSYMFFFSSLCKLSKFFTENQKNTFYKIYDKLIDVMQLDSEILNNALIGLKFLLNNDQNSEEKITFNNIKKNNYNIFNKMFMSVKEILANGIEIEEGFDKIMLNISLIINSFILLSEEKDIIFLLQNTHLLYFIEAYYHKVYFKNIKESILNILVKISHFSSNVVINMVKGRESLMENIIKKILNDNSFETRMKGIEIVYSMLNLHSLDINIELYKYGIIDQIVSVNLLNEEEPDCLKYILNSILSFINSLKSLENQWAIAIINNLIKIGITNGFEKNTRFNDEHNLMINQIKSDMNNILNKNEISSENSKSNNNIILPEMANQQKNSFNNPFLKNENIPIFGNGIP